MKSSYHRFISPLPACLCLVAITVTAYALPVSAEETLANMTVTANRAPSINVLAPITVITRADIDRLQIDDLPTLLSRQPGIDLVQYGGLGKLSSIFMRGTNSNHVLVLVDGVKWQSAAAGSTSFQYFPVEQIERIEIVRGPRSGLYGAEAIGGVIHIFTRQGQQGAAHPYAKFSYGTYNKKKAAVGVSGKEGATRYNLTVNHESTTGIDTRDHNNPDRDGYRNNSVSASVQHQTDNDIVLDAHFFRAKGFNEFDAGVLTDDKDESIQQVMGVKAMLPMNDLWSLALALSESRDELELFRDKLRNGVYRTRHRFVNVTNTFKLTPQQTVNLGFDYTVDDLDGSKPAGKAYKKESRDNKAVFISWQGNQNKHSWLLSARHDNNEAFSTYNTGVAEWGYWLEDDVQIIFNVSTAFKAPSFNQLYYPSTAFGSGGNPNLKPEEAKNYELGLKGNRHGIDWHIAMYRNNIKNLLSGWPAKNIDKANIKGVEFDLAATVRGIDIAFNASLLEPEDERTGKILQRRAQRLANLHIDKKWGTFSAGASWKLRGFSYNKADEEDRLGGYGLVDMRAAYQLAKDWSVNMNVSNVLNKHYKTAKDWLGNDYNSLGRTATLMLAYQP